MRPTSVGYPRLLCIKIRTRLVLSSSLVPAKIAGAHGPVYNAMVTGSRADAQSPDSPPKFQQRSHFDHDAVRPCLDSKDEISSKNSIDKRYSRAVEGEHRDHFRASSIISSIITGSYMIG